MEDQTADGYIPGTCNLGRDEIRHRMRIGYVGVALTFIVFIVLEIFDSPRPYRILVFPPIFYALSGFIQARHRFCFAYGWLGLLSMTGRKQFHKVSDKENARKDRITALKIVSMVLLGSMMLTAVYMVI
jgi:hypothetical protein